VIRGADGKLDRIVEYKDATSAEREVGEIDREDRRSRVDRSGYSI